MSSLPFGLVVEGMVSILLAVTIIYCLVVNRKLNALRADQAKLREVVQVLDRSTKKAENIIGELKDTASLTQHELDERIEYARSTIDRLTSLVSDANAAAKRLGAPPSPSARLSTPSVAASAETSPAQISASPATRKPVKTEMRLSNLMRGNARHTSAVTSGNEASSSSKKGSA